MVIRFLIIKIFIVFNLTSIIGQNLILDPYVNEPKENEWNLKTPCSFYTDSSFNDSSDIWWSEYGSPDILGPRFKNCNNHNSQIESKCFGLELFEIKKDNDHLYFETLLTKLLNRLMKDSIYRFQVELLFNSNLFEKNIKSIITDHINIIFKDSKGIYPSDTIELLVKKNNYKDWSIISKSFKALHRYDVLQILYIDKAKKIEADKQLYLYAYFDNFILEKENFKKDKGLIENKQVIAEQSFYFENNVSELSIDDKLNLKEFLQQNEFNIDSIHVNGFADTTFTDEYNKILSEQRAKEVFTFIKDVLEIDIGASYTGQGKETETDHSSLSSRRVDVYLFGKKEEIAPWYKTHNNPISNISKSFYAKPEEIREKEALPFYKELPTNLSLDKTAYKAEKLILSLANKAKIVIINEAHYSPSHRKFIHGLLAPLKELNFTHLAVEAIENSEDLHSLTIKDPVFYRYLLQAKKLGYKIHCYDNQSFIEPDWNTLLESVQDAQIEIKGGFESVSKDVNVRDFNQFIQIEKIISSMNVEDKLVIHVGHGHGGKHQNGFWKPLGAYLTEKYGEKNVLSIDQVTLNECRNIAKNEYVSYYNIEGSFIPSLNKRPYVEKQYDPLTDNYIQMFDLQVVHSGEMEKRIPHSTIQVEHYKEELNYPILILVYKEGDMPETDVAFSIVEVLHKEDKKLSIIPESSSYKIFIKDRENKMIQIKY